MGKCLSKRQRHQWGRSTIENAKPRTRVLFLITEFDQGGAERSLYEVVSRIDRERFAPQVACLDGEGHYSESYRALGLPVHHLGLRLTRPLALLRLASLLRRERIDVLQTFLFHANLAGRLAAALARTPVVLGAVRTAEPRHCHTLLDGLTFALVDAEVCVGEHVRAFQARRAGLPAGALYVIPNGVAPGDFATPSAPFGLGGAESLSARHEARTELGLPPDRPVVAFVGRLCPAKALPDLLTAFAAVRAEGNDPLLAIAGDGPLADEVRRSVERLGLTSRVIFTGWLQDPRRLYAAADLLALSSVVEGMPGVVLEAMASGLPVVSTDAPGCAELIVPGETGLLVPRRRPDELARALLDVLGDPEKARRMGEAGRRRAFEQFDIRRMTRRYEALYLELVRRKRRRG